MSNKNKKHLLRLKDFFKKYKWLMLLFLIFLLHLFLRFYQLETKSLFGWDQVDNAWAAKNIIADHKFPLTGVPIKGSSGFNLGPIYYYLIAPFYWLFSLDPIASGVFAGITSLLTFLTLYWVVDRLFSRKVALFAVFLHTISFAIISSDRIQWNVNFIEPVSLVVFYALYKIITGNSRYFLLLSATIGFSMHVHFTSAFYPLIIILSLPLVPRSLQTLKYIALSIPLFLVFLIPTLLAQAQIKNGQINNIQNYLQTYYHGIHLRRILQLLSDAFIQFEGVLYFAFLKPLKYVLLPLSLLLYNGRHLHREKLLLSYLCLLWFFVPWIVFSSYKGEISDYYFLINRPLVIILVSYITSYFFSSGKMYLKTLIVLFWVYYTTVNLASFLKSEENRSLAVYRHIVQTAIQKGETIEYIQGDPKSYLYYYYTRK